MQLSYLLTDPTLWKKHRKEKQDAHAETSDTEFPAVERLCVEALASLKGE